MARSFVSSITRPISSLISPVLKPAIRFAKHPLAPLGMGVAGAVVENVAEQVGVTKWLTKLGVQGFEFAKSGAQLGLETVSGIVDFDSDDEPAKTETKKTNVSGTPNAYEATTGIHVGCAADKACGPCAKKQLLAKISGALEKLSPAQVEEIEVGLSRPLIPRSHDAASAPSAVSSQIAALQAQLQQAQDAITTQKLTDQIASLQAQLAAQQGGSLSSVLQQILQLKELEAAISPAPTPPTAQQPLGPDGYPATPPWGSYQDQDGGLLQDPNGTTYGNPDIDPQFVSDPLIAQYGSNTGDPGFDAWADYSVEGVEGFDGTAYPVLDVNGECEPCKVSW